MNLNKVRGRVSDQVRDQAMARVWSRVSVPVRDQIKKEVRHES